MSLLDGKPDATTERLTLGLDQPRFLTGWDALPKLQELGIIPKGIRRVVIDIPHDDYATMYIERIVEGAVLDVILQPGISIRTIAARPMRQCERCGGPFVGRSNRRFCSDACRQRAHRAGTA